MKNEVKKLLIMLVVVILSFNLVYKTVEARKLDQLDLIMRLRSYVRGIADVTAVSVDTAVAVGIVGAVATIIFNNSGIIGIVAGIFTYATVGFGMLINTILNANRRYTMYGNIDPFIPVSAIVIWLIASIIEIGNSIFIPDVVDVGLISTGIISFSTILATVFLNDATNHFIHRNTGYEGLMIMIASIVGSVLATTIFSYAKMFINIPITAINTVEMVINILLTSIGAIIITATGTLLTSINTVIMKVLSIATDTVIGSINTIATILAKLTFSPHPLFIVSPINLPTPPPYSSFKNISSLPFSQIIFPYNDLLLYSSTIPPGHLSTSLAIYPLSEYFLTPLDPIFDKPNLSSDSSLVFEVLEYSPISKNPAHSDHSNTKSSSIPEVSESPSTPSVHSDSTIITGGTVPTANINTPSTETPSLELNKILINNVENNSIMLNIEINSRLDQIFDNTINNNGISAGDENNTIKHWANISYNNGEGNNNFKLKGINFSYGMETLFINNKIALGLATSFRKNDVIIDNNKININYITGTLYSRYNLTDIFFINGILSYFYGRYSNIKSNYNSHQLSTNISAGADTKYIIAKVGLNHGILRVDPHKDIYKNDILKNTYNFLNTTLGITFKNFINNKFKPQLFVEIGMDIIESKDKNINNLINITNNNTITSINSVDGININNSNNIFVQCGFNLNINIKNTFNVAIGYSHINRKGYAGNSVGVNVVYGF